MIRLNVLNRKLFRTLYRSRGQAIAVAMVVMCGTASFISVLSALRNLQLTRDTYYSQYRFADFEILLERAPETAVFKVEEIPGVRQARGRIVQDVTIDFPGEDEPRFGRIISMPDHRAAVINDIAMISGRYFEPGGSNEVILSDRFAKENGLEIGDRLNVKLETREYPLRIVGLALSPEYIYVIRNLQELLPNPRKFGIMWVSESFAESALDMTAARNNIVGSVDNLNDLDIILDQAQQLLNPYGVFATVRKDQQISNRFVEDEIRGLTITARIVPTTFLGISALIILVLLNRMVRKERTEIGLLKAYGYTDLAVAWYYLKFALTLAIAGCLGGFLVGQFFANQMIKIYVDIYQFPLLKARIYPDILSRSMGIAIAFAALGAFMAARTAARIHPAESMRPESPRAGHKTWIENMRVLWLRLSFSSKMIVRNISRNKFRAGLNVFGVMVSCGLLIMGFFTMDALDFMLDYQFSATQREDVKVSFYRELGKGALYDIQRMDHVTRAEPLLQYPFTVRAGWREKDVPVIGLPRNAQLQVLTDSKHRPVDIGEQGLIVSDRLARELGVAVGDLVELKPLMGRVTKPKNVIVTKIVAQYLGMSAYMNLDALSRVLDEPFAANAVLVRTDTGKEDALSYLLKDVPAIASVDIKMESYYNLVNTLSKNMAVMNTMLVFFSGVIAFSIIYNVTTVALAERQRELASLRVLGFTRAEVGSILYNENFILGFIGIVLGIPFGIALSLILVQFYDNDLYRLPFHIDRRTYLVAVGATIFFVALANLAVRRKIATLDLVEVLKARE
jgi:putative ABC transport system permease protein